MLHLFDFLKLLFSIPVLVLMIPITAICMDGIQKMTKSKHEYNLKMAKIKYQGKSEPIASSSSELEALRQEMAELRKTSSEYDLSIQHLLENLEKRVSHLESENIRLKYSNQAQDDFHPEAVVNRSDAF
jgi:anthranilate/para-aminobenzoate synthase component II